MTKISLTNDATTATDDADVASKDVTSENEDKKEEPKKEEPKRKNQKRGISIQIGHVNGSSMIEAVNGVLNGIDATKHITMTNGSLL